MVQSTQLFTHYVYPEESRIGQMQIKFPVAENPIKSWADYSTKYGLAYLMDNGSFGVNFNDNTKMMLDVSSTYIEYYEK